MNELSREQIEAMIADLDQKISMRVYDNDFNEMNKIFDERRKLSKQLWKLMSIDERLKEWDNTHKYFENSKQQAKEFLKLNVNVFDDRNIGYLLVCKHCGKIYKDSINAYRSNFNTPLTINRIVRHLDKIHNVKPKDSLITNHFKDVIDQLSKSFSESIE